MNNYTYIAYTLDRDTGNILIIDFNENSPHPSTHEKIIVGMNGKRWVTQIEDLSNSYKKHRKILYHHISSDCKTEILHQQILNRFEVYIFNKGTFLLPGNIKHIYDCALFYNKNKYFKRKKNKLDNISISFI